MVHNEGPLIKEQDRDRIFERFYRCPDTEQHVQGTGIGLCVAKKAAEAQHGHVWVVSGEAEGTTFFLSIRGAKGGRNEHSQWQNSHQGELEYLRTFMRQIRIKIEDDPARPKYLLTEAYVGYRFCNGAGA